ncbi:MAG TPA: asparagine synthase-related protein [Candidatus Mcinerneyibacteriales bacterium]|nr:asparagine synthase-related protein [Candidatus Mcinerneyibacteriales bacterium]HPE21303.1 asparagine synthase-related protein [Candidatus Mcinerneyibacteriales bacterium]HPJ70685.1 asparagine synthase-related protein [Candidatus Mcinerneyibacteriales bacterium]
MIIKGHDYTVQLERMGGYFWTGDETCRIKGFDNDGAPLDTPEHRLFTPAQWEKYLQNLNGHAAVVSAQGETLFVAADYLRTFPLFYTIQEGHLTLSDDIRNLPGRCSQKADQRDILCFDTFGYVLGNRTLCPEVFQMNAGESLLWARGVLETRIYYDYGCERTPVTDEQAFFKIASKATENTGKRLISQLEGRLALVPLSSGFDSRLVACLLKEQGYEHVLLYTYGCEESYEVRIARATAESLGYPWVRIPLNNEIYTRYRDEILRYLEYGGQCASQATLYDFVALRHGQETGLLPDKGVLIPGHIGSYLTGRYLPKTTGKAFYTADDVARHVFRFFGQFKYHFSLKKRRQVFRAVRREVLGQQGDEEWYCLAAQTWNNRFRQSRLTVNGLRHAEFIGLPWLIPLWDRALGREWYSALPSLREGDAPWRNYLRKAYFIPMKVDFPRGGPNMDKKKPGRWVNILPLSVRRLVKVIRGRMRGYPDVNDFRSLIALLHEEAGTSPSPFADHYGRMFEASRRIMTEKRRHGNT